MLSGRIRRRLITAPAPSRPTTLQLFLPRSIPRTAICIDETPFSPLALSAYAVRVEGAGHPINFAALLGKTIPHEACDKPIELWWQDEARVGQQGCLTHIWAGQGSRPAAPRDQRYDWAYIFGAVCPARGVGAALVLPEANAEAMNLHLAEISRQVSPGAHAVVVLDGAGWHQPGGRLHVPENLSLLHLPPYSPELNPVENIWQYIKQNFLSNRVYDGYDAIVDACCAAWNALMAMPDRIRSIAERVWANAVIP